MVPIVDSSALVKKRLARSEPLFLLYLDITFNRYPVSCSYYE